MCQELGFCRALNLLSTSPSSSASSSSACQQSTRKRWVIGGRQQCEVRPCPWQRREDEYWKWLRKVPRSQSNIRRIRRMGLLLNGIDIFLVQRGSAIMDMMGFDRWRCYSVTVRASGQFDSDFSLFVSWMLMRNLLFELLLLLKTSPP